MSSYKKIGLTLPEKLLQEAERIAFRDNTGRDDVICEAVDVYVLQRNNKTMYDQMKQGYTEMGSINLALAWDNRCVDAEAFNFCDYLKGRGKGE